MVTDIQTPNQVETETGCFSALPHEMSEYFMQADLTARELKLIFCFIREIIGYRLTEKIIKTDTIVARTGMHRQHFNTTIKSLIKNGIICRREINASLGLFEYSFNQQVLGRVNATKTVKQDWIFDGKAIHIKTSASPKWLHKRHQVSDGSVTKSVTIEEPKKDPEQAVEAVRQNIQKISKDILKKHKDILREKIPDYFNFKKGEMGPEEIQKRQKFLQAQALQLEQEDKGRPWNDNKNWNSGIELNTTS